MDELGKIASREELKEFVEFLRRSCTSLRTERISFISDKYPEVIEAIQNLSLVRNIKLNKHILSFSLFSFRLKKGLNLQKRIFQNLDN